MDFCEFEASLIYIVRLSERKRDGEAGKREGKERQQQNAEHRHKQAGGSLHLVLVTMKTPRPRQLF